MYAAYAKQSILCYCSLPAASPGKLGYCAIKHKGHLDSINVKCDLSGGFRYCSVSQPLPVFRCSYPHLVFGNIYNDQL